MVGNQRQFYVTGHFSVTESSQRPSKDPGHKDMEVPKPVEAAQAGGEIKGSLAWL